MTNTRVSSNGQHQFSLNLMLAKQSDVTRTYQQVSTGSKLLTGADDPTGVGRAIQMDRSLTRIDQYGDNSQTLKNRLNQQESVLEQAGDLLTRVRTLTIQANQAGISNQDQSSIASEISVLRDQLVALANADDGTGRYLFGGSQDANAPFTLNGTDVVYNGDQNQRQLQISSGLQVDDTLPGSEVFMRVRTGDGTLDASANSSNTGTGVLLDFGVTNSTTWDKSSYVLVFTASDSYELQDSSGNVLDSGSYADGDTIAYGGVQLRLQGEPAAGDSFSIGPAGTRDIFATLDNLITALGAETITAQQVAAQQNALQASLRDVTTGQQRFIDARAEGGAGQSAIEYANELNDVREVTTKINLSGIRDLDYAEALSRYNQEKMALSAAQKVFSQFKQMSLFNEL